MKVSTILKKARKYLTNEKNWGKGSMAVGAGGLDVDEKARGAKCCVGGACLRYLPDSGSLVSPAAYLTWLSVEAALSAATPKGNSDYSSYNDAKRRTHSQILRFLDRAIEKQLKKEARA
jgi:hypothetical protein